ncbi:N-acetyl-anhydromuranmyl-L-alanine amidase [Alcanivorax hongdengensis A-11-3]|uniref:1,6-anhydro-N-acetylmuramyl-L-alanine amidase AmpD n=1 Tax=Alcanivorax hongdengensis A-11-3 TaxID=1177179 RepID=L0WBT6_9GAMM|nr:1,6-anhydro-N-acetylmuramyl-L-alanine amidase AmpD [Alcanivorax hongdengensis]EKF74243.1 N-acetyl-anhydromuranmyl-L-alanine amidase [Alcanivorax hongdengensis A-11-3]
MTRHRVDQAQWCPSPNYNERPDPTDISLLVIHNISLPPGQFGGPYIEDLFLNRLSADAHPYFRDIHQLTVSSHFLVRRDGSLLQFVDCDQRAWHAGVSEFAGRENCNDFSLGIELEGADDIPYEPPQYGTLVALTALLQARYPAITDRRITGHQDIAPGRKTDPGPAFDWTEYRRRLAAFKEERT